MIERPAGIDSEAEKRHRFGIVNEHRIVEREEA